VTDSRSLAALALVTLVVLAGCGAAVDDATDGDRPSTATLTPVPLPTGTPTATATPTPMPTFSPSTPGGGLVVPGLTRGGVSDPFAFAAGHDEALTDGPYRVVTDVRLLRADGGTLYSRRTTLHVGSDGRRYRYTSRTVTDETYPVTAFAPRLALWYDGETATFRVVRNDSVQYERDPAPTGTGPVGDLSGQDRLAGLASSVDLRVTDRAIDGSYLVGGQRFATRSVLRVPALLSAPRNATFSMVLDPNGQVEEYRLTYTATFDGRPVRVVRQRSFQRADPVTEPPWLPAALNATATTPGGSEERRAVTEE
jgi:hypothetical protein